MDKFCPSRFFEASSQSKSLYIYKKPIYHLAPNKKVQVFTHDFNVVYETNEIGVRDDLNIIASNSEKIVALGDSQTFGEGVYRQDTFIELLENSVDKEIVNFGVPGYGLGQIFLHYKSKEKYLKNLKGVILFALQTLYYRKHLDDQKIESLSEYDFTKGDAPKEKEQKSRNNNSELIYFIRYLKKWYVQRDHLLEKARKKWNHTKTEYNENLLTLRKDEALDKRFIHYINMIKQVRPDLPLCIVNISTYDLKILTQIKEQIGFKYIDLSNEIVKRSQNNKLRFEYDMHYNSQTHKFIASELKQKILECLSL